MQDFQLFSMRLQDLRRPSSSSSSSSISGGLPLSSESRLVLWDLCTLRASNAFVEGFSAAKRCSNEGRALMQLDYRQFVVKLEKMSEQRPVPYQVGRDTTFLEFGTLRI